MSRSVLRRRFIPVIGLAAVALVAIEIPLQVHDRALADPPATSALVEIGGQYSIHFNGFNIGEARLEQRISGKSYVANSQVEISALLGAFHWKGVTRSAGTVSGDAIRPSGYTFEYSGTARSGSVRMGFADGAVAQLSALPVTVTPDDFVPLVPDHLKSVIDPLSALVALSRPGQAGPCGRKLALFDGKQRFNVGLVVTRKEMVPSGRAGTPVEGIVCRLKYTPIGGYRANDDTRALAESAGIEVTFRPVPQAGLWVAYRVALPTLAGSVSIEATRFDIRAPGVAQIALVD
jgi:hypothetical protein